MDKYQETFETWNKIADLYQDKFMDMDLYNESYGLFCNSIPSNAKILEIGCGPGNITKYLLSKSPDFEIMGVDVAPKMVELARINNPSASFKVMDGRRIADLKERYHGIICGFFLPFLSETDTEKFITDAHNLLLKNGLLYLSFAEGNPADSGFKT
ncbi:class I SAM-dependent methyltransferase [Antarcticibacterium sp. 1MA-6-2]|uniref:class I SAM-dependent methyltransferase n=1 Tax=Antarcticibacterium sp. 1MA-6-2 TaxID=2908210 RepID=UPI001F3CBE13|nr:class I SAM-dependent methyltransferase [Antarcticibacterium sp. 1MA-6-2]UJH90895.1 class I SAM-dependent methyltransferase [Antarcticibacterium sp. 1MA-6-2]